MCVILAVKIITENIIKKVSKAAGLPSKKQSLTINPDKEKPSGIVGKIIDKVREKAKSKKKSKKENRSNIVVKQNTFVDILFEELINDVIINAIRNNQDLLFNKIGEPEFVKKIELIAITLTNYIFDNIQPKETNTKIEIKNNRIVIYHTEGGIIFKDIVIPTSIINVIRSETSYISDSSGSTIDWVGWLIEQVSPTITGFTFIPKETSASRTDFGIMVPINSAGGWTVKLSYTGKKDNFITRGVREAIFKAFGVFVDVAIE